MRIGVIGTGSMGGILARHLAQLGHHVSIANSRGPENLTALAAEIGATPVSVVDAAKAGEVVVIAIPTKAVADLPRRLFAKDIIPLQTDRRVLMYASSGCDMSLGRPRRDQCSWRRAARTLYQHARIDSQVTISIPSACTQSQAQGGNRRPHKTLDACVG